MKKLFVILSIISSQFAFGQQSKIDSLINLLKTDKADTTKLFHLSSILNEYIAMQNYTEGIKYGELAIKESKSIVAKENSKAVINCALKYQRKVYGNTALCLKKLYETDKALDYFNKSLIISSEIRDTIGIIINNINMGNIRRDRGDFRLAQEHYYKTLDILRSFHDKKYISTVKTNMGMCFELQGNHSEARKCHLESLKLHEELNDKIGIAKDYNNIAMVYYGENNLPSALKYFKLALEIKENIGALDPNAYSNLGTCYGKMGNYEEELKNIKKGLEISIEQGNKESASISYVNKAVFFLRIGKFNDAKIDAIKSLSIAKDIKSKPLIANGYGVLAQIDSAAGDYKGAYANKKLEYLYNDSLNNEENNKKILQIQMNYEYEIKESILKTEHKSELKNQELIADERNRKQKLVTSFVIGGLLLVLVFAGFVFRSLRITKKQKLLIEQQKIIVEQHQKDIIDSIHYAKRIQTSILPTEKYIEKNINRLKK